MRRTGNRGQVLLVFLGALLALLGVAALGIDVGYLYTVRHELQRCTDAGALAGASAFFDGNWSDAAIRALADTRARAFASKDKVATSALSSGGEISSPFPQPRGSASTPPATSRCSSPGSSSARRRPSPPTRSPKRPSPART